MKIPKNLMPLVEEISDERSMGDGYWIYLVPGYINTMTEVHMVHEDTVKECLIHLRNYIKPCNCEECKKL